MNRARPIAFSYLLGTLTAFLLLSEGIAAMEPQDVNGDGTSDLVWRNKIDGNTAIWLLNGTGISATSFPGGVPLEWKIAGVGDVTGDGKAEVIWHNNTTGTVAVWLMNGLTITSVGFPGSASTDWVIQAIGDVDGDGQADLVWRNSNDGVLAIWIMNGATIASSGFLGGVPLEWQVAGIGDVTGDGKADVIWRNNTTGTVAVWLMNGLIISSVDFPGSASLDFQIVGVGDVNDDGQADLVWRNTNSGEVVVWLLNGAAIGATGNLGGLPLEWQIAQIGDADGDGKADLIWYNTTSGAVVCWLLNGLVIGSEVLAGTVSTDWEIAGNATQPPPITGGGGGTLTVTGAPAAVGGMFVSTFDAASRNDQLQLGTVGWLEETTTINPPFVHAEVLGVVFHLGTGQINSLPGVSFTTSDVSTTTSSGNFWSCTGSFQGPGLPSFPGTCQGISVNPAAGTATFSNTVLQDIVTGMPPITLNGTVTFPPFQTGTPSPPPPTILTTTLPAGTVGQPYSTTLRANGGNGTFTWSTVPPNALGAFGLTLDPNTGVISGTPTNLSAGTLIIIQVASGGNTEQKALSLSISGGGSGGGSSSNIPISTTSNGERDPQIISDAQGGAIIVWENCTCNARTGDIYAQRINSAGVPQWGTNGVPITTAINDQDHPQLIPDGAGGAIIVWEDRRGGETFPDIFAQRINSDGVAQWTPDGVPIAIAQRQIRPRLATDGAGGAIIVWESGASNVDVHTQRVNSAGILQWPIAGVSLGSTGSGESLPEIVADGSGGAIIAWMGNRVVDQLRVRAQRVNSAGVPQWADGGVPITDFPQRFIADPGRGGPPKLVQDGSGGAIIAWVGGGEGSGLRAQRVDPNGVPQWVANGVILNPSEFTFLAGIVTDGANGAILTGTDMRNGADLDVFAQRVTDTGQVSWTPDGVPISTAIGDQEAPQIVSNGNGGAIIVWQDKRTITEFDLFAQQVDGDGNVQWTTDGLAVSQAMFDQWFADITTDGAGGAIMAWQDERNDPLNAVNQVGGQDIFSQRVSSAGVLQ